MDPYLAENFFYRVQKRNPLSLCAFLPIDPRKIEIINGPVLKMRRRAKILDLPHFFKTSCLRCISMFKNGKYMEYIPHCSDRHGEIEIREDAYFYKKYFQQVISDLLEKSNEIEKFINEIENETIIDEKSNIDEIINEIESEREIEFEKYISAPLSTTLIEKVEKEDRIVLYKKNNQFYEAEMKKKDELILQLIQNNYTTKKFITKKIYVKQSNTIFIFYIIITAIIVFSTLMNKF